MSNIAPNNNNETARFLRDKVNGRANNYRRMCLQLQRQARGLPAVYPSAITAAMATPKNERVTHVGDLRRGMVAFSTDDKPGTFGHIFFIAGRKNGRLLTISNDVKSAGYVDYVDFDFYQQRWGQRFLFGATYLNGYDFSDFNKAPEPVERGSVGDRYLKALEWMERTYRSRAKEYGDDNELVKRLKTELNHMRKTAKKYGG